MNTDKIKRHYKVKSNIIGLTDVVVVKMNTYELCLGGRVRGLTRLCPWGAD